MESSFMQELRKIFTEQAQVLESHGQHIDVDEIMEEFEQIGKPKFDLEDGEFNGFSDEQIERMIYQPLEPGCPVQLRYLSDDEIERYPSCVRLSTF